jgi:hypothetical protein
LDLKKYDVCRKKKDLPKPSQNPMLTDYSNNSKYQTIFLKHYVIYKTQLLVIINAIENDGDWEEENENLNRFVL